VTPILEVERVSIAYDGRPSVKDVSMSLNAGDVVGLVGESGSGKTTLGMAVLNLLPSNATMSGTVRFRGRDLSETSRRALRSLRGNEMSLIMQNPSSALDPAYSIGDQFVELFRAHRKCSRKEALADAARWLEKVGFPSPESRLRAYSHQFSGGMNQRLVIAMALALDPKLLIADEPTSALDVTAQAQILELLRSLIAEFDGACLIISHDLGVVAQLATRVAVMYQGEIVEEAPVQELFASPAHQYTKHLLACQPRRRGNGSADDQQPRSRRSANNEVGA